MEISRRIALGSAASLLVGTWASAARSQHLQLIPDGTLYGEKAGNSVSAGPDDGGNANLARIFWQAQRHDTTRALAKNLEQCSTQTFGNISVESCVVQNHCICGHGQPGLLDTGIGSWGTRTDQFVSFWNESAWRPYLTGCIPEDEAPWLNFIDIYSCDTGAGYEGALFLWKLAKLWKRKVRARTGLLYTYPDKIFMHYEPWSQWQVGLPTSDAPEPAVASPSPGGDGLMKLLFGEPLADLAIQNLRSAEIQRRSGDRWISGGANRAEAMALWKGLFHTALAPGYGIPLGIATARLTFHLEDRTTVNVDVVAGRLSVVTSDGLKAYVSPSFGRLLDRLVPVET